MILEDDLVPITTLHARIFETVATIGGVEPGLLATTMHFRSDLGFDAVDLCDTALLVEEAFGIAILPEEEARLTDLESLVVLVNRKLAGRGK
ncbi:MAG: acyl carrier protein [Alphaproteobacteria bacterium]